MTYIVYEVTTLMNLLALDAKEARKCTSSPGIVRLYYEATKVAEGGIPGWRSCDCSTLRYDGDIP